MTEPTYTQADLEAAVRRALTLASNEAAGEVAAHGESVIAPFIRRSVLAISADPAKVSEIARGSNEA